MEITDLSNVVTNRSRKRKTTHPGKVESLK